MKFKLNGFEVEVELRGSELLLDVLRDKLGATGTKEACGEGECGACTVLVDGRALNACLMVAAEVQGCEVTTVESRAHGGLANVQRAFSAKGGIQCGFCTPGMVMSTTALLQRAPAPSEEQIRAALTGNLCRCTGYTQIVESVQDAAANLSGEGSR